MSTEIVKQLLRLAREVDAAATPLIVNRARLERIADGIREQAVAVRDLPARTSPPPYTVSYASTKLGPTGEAAL